MAAGLLIHQILPVLLGLGGAILAAWLVRRFAVMRSR